MASHCCCPRQIVSNSVTSQSSLFSPLNHRRIAPPAARTHLLSSLRNQGLSTVSLTGLRVEGKASEARRWSTRASAAGMGAGAGGGEAMGENESPYLILGVSALEKFEVIKAAYGRRRKDAEKRGDDATVERLDKAYDRIMMMQLSNRRKGISFGGVGVSKEIKYADKRSWFPWGPKKAVVEKNDMLINLGIAVLLTAWCAVLGGQTDWKPLQFMIFGYIFRIFTKLGEFDAPAPSSFVSEDEEGEEGGAAPEDTGRRLRNGKRLLRTLGLVFSCVAFASLAYTGTLNAYEYFLQYVPRVLMGAQELFVTGVTAVGLFIMASFYR